MRTHIMMGLLLIGASFGTTTLFADAAQAQSQRNRQSQMGKPVSSAKPNINRSKSNGGGSARPSPNRAAYNDKAGAGRANANQNRNGQNRNGQERYAQNGANRNGNRGGQTRPGQKGYRGPDNVVVVNGRPGNGYYDNGNYYNNNNRYDNDRYDDDDNDFLEFVGKTAAITAGVSVVSAVIGDVVQDKPSDDCQEQIQNGQVYLLCNGTWYTPAQAGGQEAYQVVAPPQSSGPPPIDR